MGISPSIANLLAGFAAEQDLAGRSGAKCLTLGKQLIHLTEGQLFEILARTGLARVDGGQATLHERIGRNLLKLREENRTLSTFRGAREKGEISDEMLFQALGFDELRSLDANVFEGADFAFDLNTTGIVEAIGEPFDWVLDCGTMEHVFHVPNVFRNIFDAVKVGGWAVQITPCNNMVDHGFYQVSPMLFFQYYLDNGYEDVKCMIMRQTAGSILGEPTVFFDYLPGILNDANFGASDAFHYCAVVRARKTEATTWDAVPQQLSYQQKWV